MWMKSGLELKRIILLLCVMSPFALMGAVPAHTGSDQNAESPSAADAPLGSAAANGDAVKPDRISFYNVPVDSKLESHLDYADGRTETIEYATALCAAGTVITQTLNLYTATFVADGCEATVFQQLNLRWLGACRFEFEHDPDARIVARGPYGETVIADAHYPAGELELNNLPADTTDLAVTMSYVDEQGRGLTGNVAFSFHTPHPGCSSTPIATTTPTPTATDIPPEGAAPTDTPTPTSTPETPLALDPVDEPGVSPLSMTYLPLIVR